MGFRLFTESYDRPPRRQLERFHHGNKNTPLSRHPQLPAPLSVATVNPRSSLAVCSGVHYGGPHVTWSLRVCRGHGAPPHRSLCPVQGGKLVRYPCWSYYLKEKQRSLAPPSRSQAETQCFDPFDVGIRMLSSCRTDHGRAVAF